MVKIAPFEVEEWMNRFETRPGILNIAETCADSVSVEDLVAMCDDKNTPGPISLSTKLTYGAIRGSHALRQNIAALYNTTSASSGALPSPALVAEDILITQGAIAANFLVFYTLVGPGDHVICVYPTYQQLYAVPESLGAEVSLWKLKPENSYIPDIEDLKALIKPNTKLIVLNNPNNPTGATTPLPVLSSIISLAQSHNITILSDEVYSPLFHSHPSPPPSILSLNYPNTFSTGSMSKAFSLAGIRLGWIATRNHAILESISSARDYTSISISQLDDQVASYALSPAVFPHLLERNMNLARTNLELVGAFVEKYGGVCDWVKPTAGTTALVRFRRSERKGGGVVVDEEFVLELLEATGVLFMPASPCFGRGEDFKGLVRMGYVCATEVLKEGLEKLGGFVEERLI